MKQVAQAGFTLIELMIVVAIIGILAAIALPQYQVYVAKTQLTRVVGEAAALKTALDSCILDGRMTIGVNDSVNPNNCDPQASSSSLITGNAQGTGAPAVVGINGYAQVSSPLTGAGGDQITALIGGNAAVPIQGATVTWTRDGNGIWACSTTAPQRFAPQGCPGL